MKNIIYQYWQGEMKPGVVASTKLMKAYAERIGAEYRFDHNITIAGKFVNVPIYYEPANPLVDASFDLTSSASGLSSTFAGAAFFAFSIVSFTKLQ